MLETPETRQVQERLVLTVEHMQVPGIRMSKRLCWHAAPVANVLWKLHCDNKIKSQIR